MCYNYYIIVTVSIVISIRGGLQCAPAEHGLPLPLIKDNQHTSTDTCANTNTNTTTNNTTTATTNTTTTTNNNNNIITIQVMNNTIII